mmetsp:Transcript_34413/g.79929  ORF Transcript_34413/g.79929 Transcript_34413/m.79929 type:complete len:87 (+) Transcript_34413:115-375(+)
MTMKTMSEFESLVIKRESRLAMSLRACNPERSPSLWRNSSQDAVGDVEPGAFHCIISHKIHEDLYDTRQIQQNRALWLKAAEGPQE